MNLAEQKQVLKKSLEYIDNKLSEANSPGPEDMEGIIGHGMEIASIIGLCAKNLADANVLINKNELIYMQANKDLWSKPTVLKKLMEGELAEENGLVVWADRLMSACTHKMDFYRSVVSKYKEELRLNNTFNTQR